MPCCVVTLSSHPLQLVQDGRVSLVVLKTLLCSEPSQLTPNAAGKIGLISSQQIFSQLQYVPCLHHQLELHALQD